MKKVFALLIIFISVYTAYANILFENGKSDYSIVIPQNASASEEFAAAELQSLLLKSGQVTLPIVSVPGKKGRNIFIKTVPNGKKLEVRDQIIVKYDNGDLILQGNKGYCALFAVYRFAEKQLGFRWLYPGESGEFYKPKSKFQLSPAVSEVFIPKIRFRFMFMVNGVSDIDSEKWILHNYGNIGLRSKEMRAKVDVPSGHIQGFAELRGSRSKLFKEHPEYFSLIDGKRSVLGWGGCWTNPGYIDFFVNDVINKIQRDKYEILFIVAPDTTMRCECANCTAEKSKPDRWINLFRTVYARVKARYPDIKLGTCAYHEYRELPVSDVRFADIPTSFSFSNRCYVHKLNDPKCPYQMKSLGEIKKWKDKFGGDISINCYENALFRGFHSYAPIMNILIDQMKFFGKLDPCVLRTEFPMSARWVKNAKIKWNYDFKEYCLFRLTNYIFVTMMHSPELDGKKMIQEYCDTLYGPAGKVMYKYHSEMAEAWDQMNLHLVWYFNNAGPVSKHLLNTERINKFNNYFSQAEKIVRSKPEYARYIKEIEVDKVNYDLWVKYYNANFAVSWEVPLGKGKEKAFKFSMINRTLDPRTNKPLAKPFNMTTTGTLARDENFLYVHVDCFTEPGYKLNKGIKNRDDSKLWHGDNVDIMLRTSQQSDYFHLGVNPAGGIFDSRINDTSWNPLLDIKTGVFADRWTADIKIPFNQLGFEGSPDGTEWAIAVMRYNSDGRAAGFPVPVFNQISATAKLKFDNNASPEKTLTYIVSEKKPANLILNLANAGWMINKETFREGWTKRSNGKEVILLTPGSAKEAPRHFYRNRIDSALENGSLVIFDDDSWTGWRHLFGKEFPKEYYRHKDLDKTETLYWVDSKSTPEYKKKIESMIRTAGSSAYIPQEGWHVLAVQKLRNGESAPVMMYKQHRNGMVALILGFRHIRQNQVHASEFIEFLVKRWKEESAEWKKQAQSKNKAITIILPEKPDRYYVAPQFAEVSGWWVDRESFIGNWMKRSTGKEVILLTPGPLKEAPDLFYRNRIDSALDNGSLVIFNDDSLTGWRKLFGAEFPQGYHRIKEINSDLKFFWVDSKSTPQEKELIDKIVPVAAPVAYTVTPGWHVLAQVELKNGQFAPVMMYKKHRNGMIALILGMRYIKRGKVPDFTEFLIRRWQQECNLNP